MNINIKELTKRTKKYTLLYAEDDDTISKATLDILGNFFDNIIFAPNGKLGLEKFNENHIDLIITDINMPQMSGLEMLKEISLLNSSVPSIITTAHNEQDYYKDAIDLNVKGYILKPIVISKLLTIISEIIDDIEKQEIQEKNFKYLVEANRKLIDIGYKISSEKNYNKLLENILMGAKDLSNADGGTLYIFNQDENSLEFKIVSNSSLKISHGGSHQEISWPALKLYDSNNQINRKNVSIMCAYEEKLVNIDDIYNSTTYDFSGAKSFDAQNNYRTKSMLVIPMKNREDELIGVIQLINKTINNTTVSFNKDDEELIKSMSSQAAMMLENNYLVDELENFLYALIKSIGSALDVKSRQTATHVQNVAQIALFLADGVSKDETIFKDIKFNQNQLEELKLSAWLHDIGKISTPEHIINKATKLEALYDRIDIIKAKFEIFKKDIEISHLKGEITKEQMNIKIAKINNDVEFLNEINNGQIFMSQEYINKLKEIYEYEKIGIDNQKVSLIDDDEYLNLSIKRGTLNDKDREIINNHVVVTYDMLKDIPFPKKYKNVPKIAGSHHKTIDKKGYSAKEIFEDEMSVQDKILAIADVFEALSSSDRPYKDPFNIDEISAILNNMVKTKSLDKDIVELLLEKQLYMPYALEKFKKSQFV